MGGESLRSFAILLAEKATWGVLDSMSLYNSLDDATSTTWEGSLD